MKKNIRSLVALTAGIGVDGDGGFLRNGAGGNRR